MQMRGPLEKGRYAGLDESEEVSPLERKRSGIKACGLGKCFG